MTEDSREFDMRDAIVLVRSLSVALTATSIAVLIAFIMFAVFGVGPAESWDRVQPIAALTFAGSFLGSAIGYGIAAKRLRSNGGARSPRRTDAER